MLRFSSNTGIAAGSAPFAELVTATNFSFLSGASHAQDLVLTALLLGQSGIGIADRNSVAGVVRAYGTLEDLRNGELLIEKQRRSGPGNRVQGAL